MASYIDELIKKYSNEGKTKTIKQPKYSVTQRTGSKNEKQYDALQRAILATTNKSVKERTGSGNNAGAYYFTFTAANDYIKKHSGNINAGLTAKTQANNAMTTTQQINPYAPNYGQYSAEDYGYTAPKAEAVTATTPTVKEAKTAAERADENREAQLLDAYNKAVEEANNAADLANANRGDSALQRAADTALAKANRALKDLQEFQFGGERSEGGGSQKFINTAQSVVDDAEKAYKRASVAYAFNRTESNKRKMESAKSKMLAAKKTLEDAKSERRGSVYYTDAEGNQYATKAELDEAIEKQGKETARYKGEEAADRALLGGSYDRGVLDEETKARVDETKAKADEEDAKLDSLKQGRTDAAKAERDRDIEGNLSILEQEVRDNPTAFASNVAAGQASTKNKVAYSLRTDGASPYTALTKYEQETYEALLGAGKEKEADEYLELLTDKLARRSGITREKIAKTKDPTLAGLEYMAVSVGSGVQDALRDVVNAGKAVVGDDNELGTTAQGYYRQERMQDIAAGETGSKFEKVAGDMLYSIGRMTPAIATSLVGAPSWVATAITGTSAAGGAYADGIENGMTNLQAGAYALVSGATEALFEKFLGGIEAFTGGKSAFGKMIDDALENVAGKSKLLDVVSSFASNFGSEFAEETMQSILEPIIKNAIANSGEKINLGNSIYEGLLGGLTGGAIGGVSDIQTYAQSGGQFATRSAAEAGRTQYENTNRKAVKGVQKSVSDSDPLINGIRKLNKQAKTDAAAQAQQTAENDAQPQREVSTEKAQAATAQIAKTVSKDFGVTGKDAEIAELVQHALENGAISESTRAKVQEFATNILEGTEYTVENEEGTKLRAFLKNNPIKLTDAEAKAIGAAYGGYVEFKRNAKEIRVTKTKGTELTKIAKQLQSAFPEFFKGVDASDPAQVMTATMNALNSTKAQKQTRAYANANTSTETDRRALTAKIMQELRKAEGKTKAQKARVNERTGLPVSHANRKTNILAQDEVAAWNTDEAKRGRFFKNAADALTDDQGELGRVASIQRKSSKDSLNADDLAQNVRTASQRAQVILESGLVDRHGNKVGVSFNELVDQTNLESPSFQEYLAEKRNIETRQRGKSITARKAKESQAFVERMERLHPEYKANAEKIYSWLETFTKLYGEASGMISPDSLAYMRMLEHSYIPVIRESTKLDQIAGRPQRKQKSVKPGEVVKRLEGGTGNILDLRESMAAYINNMVKQAAVNDLHKNIYDFAQSDPNAKYFVAVAAEQDASAIENLDELGQNLDYEYDTKDASISKNEKNSGNYTMSVKINGETVKMYVSKPMYDALHRLEHTIEKDPVAKAFSKLTGVQKSLLTQYNPLFILRNIPRDFQTYLDTTDSKGLKAIASYIKAAVPRAGTEQGKYWQLYKDMGLKTTRFLAGNDSYEGYVDASKSIVENIKSKNIKGVGKNLLEGMEALGEWSENIARFAEFKNTLERLGDTPENRIKAANAAAEITVNFAKGGFISKYINNYVPYFNAGIQGVTKMARQFKSHPVRATYRYIARATAVSLILNAILGNYKNENYEDLNDRAKSAYFNIPNWLGEKDENGKPKTFIKIRRGEAQSLFGALGETLVLMMAGKEEFDWDTLKTVAAQGLGNMAPNNPLESNFFAPFIDLKRNEDFAGREIYSSAMEGLDPSLMYDADTSKLAIALGKLGIAPKGIDYVLKSYGGDIVKGVLSLMSTSGSGKNPLSAFMTSFVADPRYSSGPVSDFYDDMDELTREISLIEEGADYVEGTVTPEHYRLKVYKDIAAEMSKLSKQERKIEADESLTAEQKTTRINNLREQRNKLAKGAKAKANDAVKEYKKTYVPEFSSYTEDTQEKLRLARESGLSPAKVVEVYKATKSKESTDTMSSTARKVRYIEGLEGVKDKNPLYEAFIFSDSQKEDTGYVRAKLSGVTPSEYYDITTTEGDVDETTGKTIANTKKQKQIGKILNSSANDPWKAYKAVFGETYEDKFAEKMCKTDRNFLDAYSQVITITSDKDRNGDSIRYSKDKKIRAYLAGNKDLTRSQREVLYIMVSDTKDRDRLVEQKLRSSNLTEAERDKFYGELVG